MTTYPAKSGRIFPVKDDLFRTIKRFFAITGVLILFLIATSDGEWFPWGNFVALGGLFGIAKAWG